MVLYWSDIADIEEGWNHYKEVYGSTANNALDFIDKEYSGYDEEDKNVIFATISLIEESA